MKIITDLINTFRSVDSILVAHTRTIKKLRSYAEHQDTQRSRVNAEIQRLQVEYEARTVERKRATRLALKFNDLLEG